MRKVKFALVVLSALVTQQVFADTVSTPCKAIASACLNAGFVESDSSTDKNIWFNCMKPIILGQSVTGVTVDASVVQSCKTDKIAKLQQELAELQGNPAS